MALTVAELEAVFSADTSRFDRGNRRVQGGVRKTEGFLSRAASTAVGFVGALAFQEVARGAVRLGTAAFHTAGQIQLAKKTLTGLYGSAKQARNVMADLRKVASHSPIDTAAFMEGAQQLAYMGIKGDKAVTILKHVSEAVVAVGGSSEDVGRVTDAMLQMVNQGKVYVDELNEISAAGVPIFSALAKHFDTNIAHVRKMVEQGKVSIDDVMASIRNAEGSTFKKMIRASKGASDTFANQWQNAKDNVTQALGKVFLPLIKDLTPFISKLGTELPRVISDVTAQLRNMGAVQLFTHSFDFLGDVLKGLTTSKVVQGFGKHHKVKVPFVPETKGEKLGAQIRRLFKNAFSGDDTQGIIDQWVKDINRWLGGVNWKKVARTIGTGVSSALATSSRVTEALTGALVQLMARVNWSMVVASMLAGLVYAVVNGAKGAIDDVWRIGQMIGNGIADGFGDWVYKNVRPWVSPIYWIVDLIKKALGIHSPSQVFVRIGHQVVQGLINGILGAIPLALRGAHTLIRRLLKPFIGSRTWLRDNGRQLVNGFTLGIKKQTSNAVSQARAVGLRARRVFNSAGKWLRGEGRALVRGLQHGVADAEGALLARIQQLGKRLIREASKPIRYLINKVINAGIIDRYNTVAGWFNVDKVKHVKKFAGGGPVGGGWEHGRGSPSQLAAGGPVRGAGTATSDSIPADLSNNEHVWTAREVAGAGGHGAVERMRAMARAGRMGFARGGRASLIAFGKWLRRHGARVGENPAFGGVSPVHVPGSYHYRGRAIDVNYGPGGTSKIEKRFFDKLIKSGIARSRYGLRSIWRYPGHFNHAHFDTANSPDLGMAQGGGGGFLNPFAGLLKKINKHFKGSGIMGQLVKGVGVKLAKGAAKYVQSLNPFGVGGGSVVSGHGGVKSILRRTAATFGWGGRQVRDLFRIVSHESGFRPGAQNPTSSAYGLFQFLNSTWRSVGGHKTSNAALQALYGMRYIKQRYHSPAGAWRFWQRHHWYDNGGWLMPNHPQNNTGKPEAVLTPAESRAFVDLAKRASGGDTGGPMIGEMVFNEYGGTAREAWQEFDFQLRTRNVGALAGA